MWACAACTYENSGNLSKCEVCETPRGGAVESNEEDPELAEALRISVAMANAAKAQLSTAKTPTQTTITTATTATTATTTTAMTATTATTATGTTTTTTTTTTATTTTTTTTATATTLAKPATTGVQAASVTKEATTVKIDAAPSRNAQKEVAAKIDATKQNNELLPAQLELERNFSTSSWGEAEVAGDDGEGWEDEEEVVAQEDAAVALHAAALKELKRDVFELDRLHGHHAGFVADGDLLRVHVGISCEALGVSIEQAQVWRMDYSKMIVVTIDFDRLYAASENAPQLKEIKVYQSKDTNFFQTWLNTQKQDFGLSWLLQSRLKNTFFRPPYFPVKQWATRKVLPPDEADEFQLFEDKSGLAPQVQEVVEATGVDQHTALAALRYCKKDTSSATDLLLDSKKKQEFLALLHEGETKQTPSSSSSSSQQTQASQTKSGSKMSNLFRKKPKTQEGTKGQESTKVRIESTALVDLAESNFLVRMTSFVTESIVSSGANCMMCWKSLQFSGFKPTCCDSTLCLFKYRDLGLGVSVLDEIKQAPEVADLLISFAVAATHEHRIEWYFPRECVAKGNGTEDLSFLESNGRKNIELLLQVLNHMPPVSEMVRFQQDSSLKEALDSRHKLLYPLLQWLIRSNRSHLRLLSKSEMCPDGPAHQFLLLTSDPTREQHFREQKRALEKKNGKGNGSILLTHGSGIGNWHVILRTGLKTSKSSDLDTETKVGLKGTAGIAEGGAIGASGGAIWMSMQPGVSMGYTKVGSGWTNSLFGNSIGCMAICEVVNDPSKRITSGNAPGGSHVEGPHEYVCTDVRTIATRYFWVWPSTNPPQCNSARLGAWDGHSVVGPGTITHLLGFPDSVRSGI